MMKEVRSSRWYSWPVESVFSVRVFTEEVAFVQDQQWCVSSARPVTEAKNETKTSLCLAVISGVATPTLPI